MARRFSFGNNILVFFFLICTIWGAWGTTDNTYTFEKTQELEADNTSRGDTHHFLEKKWELDICVSCPPSQFCVLCPGFGWACATSASYLCCSCDAPPCGLCPSNKICSAGVSGCSDDLTVHPANVILIPGLGGSRLYNVSTRTTPSFTNRVWLPSVIDHFLGFDFQRMFWAEYDAHLGVLSLDRSSTLLANPYSSNFGLGEIDSLLDTSLFSNAVVYLPMINKFQLFGYKPQIANNDIPMFTHIDNKLKIFGFPYDWRQSNYFSRNIAELKQRIWEASVHGQKQVDIVTHSMGGLLMQSTLRKFPNETIPHIRKWVAIACPWLGAPAAVDAFLDGYTIHPRVNTATQGVAERSFLSVYELYPAPSERWIDGAPSFIVNGTQLPPEQFIRYLKQKTANSYFVNPVRAGSLIYSGWNDIMWENASTSKTEWSKPLEIPTIDFLNVVGVGTETKFRYNADTKTWYTADGDGTVPVASAMTHPITQAKTIQNAFFRDEHQALIKNQRVIEMVVNFLRADSGVQRSPTCPAYTFSLFAGLNLKIGNLSLRVNSGTTNNFNFTFSLAGNWGITQLDAYLGVNWTFSSIPRDDEFPLSAIVNPFVKTFSVNYQTGDFPCGSSIFIAVQAKVAQYSGTRPSDLSTAWARSDKTNDAIFISGSGWAYYNNYDICCRSA